MEEYKEKFRMILNGKETSLHILKNKKGMRIAITNYGARIVAVIVKDKNGNDTDVVAGFDSINGYLNSTEGFYGAIVGRYANRIAFGKFSLDEKDYTLSTNLPPHHLHGGPNGFHVQVWDVVNANEETISLSYFSKDSEEGFPGNVNVTVTYTLTENNELVIDYEATTDQPTIINLTSHPYFNLNGQGSGAAMNHLLQINADSYSLVDETLIPKRLVPVEGTPFDFTEPKTIGRDIGGNDEQLKFGSGYDHNFVLNGRGFRGVAKATGDVSGITMEVLTDQPGLQLYTANHLNGSNQLKYGLKDYSRGAFCLETQHFPDGPNQPMFPSTTLKPGEVYESRTVYGFS